MAKKLICSRGYFQGKYCIYVRQKSQNETEIWRKKVVCLAKEWESSQTLPLNASKNVPTLWLDDLIKWTNLTFESSYKTGLPV